MVSENIGMLIGAVATAGVDAGLEAYFVVAGARNQFPYLLIHPSIPPLDDWIANVGTPLALYALGKVLKKKLLINMAKGGAVYGFSELLGITVYRVAKIAEGAPVLSYMVAR